jgi:hypothetical protein
MAERITQDRLCQVGPNRVINDMEEDPYLFFRIFSGPVGR